MADQEMIIAGGGVSDAVRGGLVLAVVGPEGTGVCRNGNQFYYLKQTLTEVFPCFFLSCKANARVYLAGTARTLPI
jgi:hypothetical protein